MKLTKQEWILWTTALVTAVGIYFALIHPSIEQVAERESALEAKSAAEQQLETARQKYAALRRQIDAARDELEALGGSPPKASERDRQIARLTRLAQDCRIIVDSYRPVDEVALSDHTAFYIEFMGRAPYPAIQRYLRRLEEEIDFVDTTHFSINSADSGDSMTCVVSWCCRVNGIRLQTEPNAKSPKDKRPLGDPEKVAWNEP